MLTFRSKLDCLVACLRLRRSHKFARPRTGRREAPREIWALLVQGFGTRTSTRDREIWVLLAQRFEARTSTSTRERFGLCLPRDLEQERAPEREILALLAPRFGTPERERQTDRQRVFASACLAESNSGRFDMDPAASQEAGAPWNARAGSAAAAASGGAAGVADNLASSSQRISNPRVSRWSDAPPGQGDANPATDRRPSPAGLEPPYKKVRNDSPAAPGQGSSVDYRGDAAPAYGVDSGYGEGPPGLAYGRSGAVAAGAGGGVSGGAQNYGVSASGESYGTGYATQQMSSYAPQTYAAPQGGPVSFAPGSAKGTGSLFYKTKLCTKFKSGSCTFNERCHFAHGVEELRKPPPGWEDMVAAAGGSLGSASKLRGPPMGGVVQQRKSKLCRYFVDGNCPYGDRCNFLHGNDEGQQTPGMEPPAAPNAGVNMWGGPAARRTNYKTRLCAKWERGEQCEFGDKCNFAHGHAELQAYTGVPTYPNGSMVTPDVQYSSVNPEMAAPKMYADANVMNPPPLAAPYGAPIDYASAGGPAPVAASTYNPYATAGTAVMPFPSSQDGNNGATANYNYWDPQKMWDGTSAVPVQPAASAQGYVQANQALPWVPDYSVDSGYARRENDTAVSQYPQVQPQQQQLQLQQPQVQQVQQQQGIPYFRGDYQDPKLVNQPYVQDDSQSKYQGEVRNGDGGYYQGSYNEATYPSQQADYSVRYNVAEAWGGKM